MPAAAQKFHSALRTSLATPIGAQLLVGYVVRTPLARDRPLRQFVRLRFTVKLERAGVNVVAGFHLRHREPSLVLLEKGQTKRKGAVGPLMAVSSECLS